MRTNHRVRFRFAIAHGFAVRKGTEILRTLSKIRRRIMGDFGFRVELRSFHSHVEV